MRSNDNFNFPLGWVKYDVKTKQNKQQHQQVLHAQNEAQQRFILFGFRDETKRNLPSGQPAEGVFSCSASSNVPTVSGGLSRVSRSDTAGQRVPAGRWQAQAGLLGLWSSWRHRDLGDGAGCYLPWQQYPERILSQRVKCDPVRAWDP